MKIPFPPRRAAAAVRRSQRQADDARDARRAFAAGVAGKVVLVVLVLAAFSVLPVYVNNAFGYVPLFCALLALAADFAYVQVLAALVSWRQEARMRDCPRGQGIEFRIRVRNRSVLLCFHARAHFYVSDLLGGVARDNPVDLVLGPRTHEDYGFTVNFEHLGTYSAGIDRMEFSGFLGLFTRTVAGSQRAQVQVTPTIHDIEHLGFSTSTPTDSKVALKTVADDSLDYAGVREYRRGDALKRMHWGLSAKGNKTLYTKTFETPSNPGVAVVLDFDAPAGCTAEELSGMFDTVVESAFSIDAYAHGIGMESELLFADRYGETVRRSVWRRDELGQMVEDMPRMKPGGDSSVVGELVDAEAHSIYAQGNIVICTANPTARVVDAAVNVKMGRRNPVVVLALPPGQTQRERKRWCAPFSRLDAAGIGYVLLEGPDAIGKVSMA